MKIKKVRKGRYLITTDNQKEFRLVVVPVEIIEEDPWLREEPGAPVVLYRWTLSDNEGYRSGVYDASSLEEALKAVTDWIEYFHGPF